MKVIDLLNKIVNGEEVPQKIKIGDKIYNYETFNIGKGDNYFTAEWKEVKGYRISYDGTYYYLEIRDYDLNDEVEIIEDNKIEKLDIQLSSDDENKVNCYRANNLQCDMAFKINEIIEVLNEKDR